MPFCRECGTETKSFHRYCRNCGTEVGAGATEMGVSGPVAQEVAPVLNYYLSANRILLMSVLSYGLYLLYWFYLTWKHYRDHTHAEAFPVWHALTLFVPIYGLFRTHAHMRSYKELMNNSGVTNTINPEWAVGLLAITWLLGIITNFLSGGFDLSKEISQQTAIVITFLDVISVVIVARLLLHVQGNLNRYWSGVNNLRVGSAAIGVGEVILALIGVLLWANTLALLLSSSYRAGV